MTILFRTFFSIIAMVLLNMPLDAAYTATLPLGPDSFHEIMGRHQRSSFVLVLWSVECPPCITELGVLAAALNQHPGINLVMISTDEADLLPKVEALLQKHGLQHVESWIFGTGDSRRLRNQIDINWYGELPRSYFYDAQGGRMPLTGGITAELINAWLARNQH
ncbi:hypothetical protein [Methylococcus sp. Mc7]|uniref:TlpA family protein disulfide reductase n=1 Tax=Methylococcus sp. Mc7 TaxID=2860258 RepID=UPI001C530C6F|nr:hypothetical protein [Methylococcus sp. Mc7]QXP84384.1 hypothetical protein KW115_01015 [Methylococcus sp. Mc7]